MNSLDESLVVFELDTNLAARSSATLLILYEIKDNQLVTVYDPRKDDGEIDSPKNENVMRIIKERGAKAYVINLPLSRPKEVLGLILNFEDYREWGCYESLNMHFWRYDFEREGIEVKEMIYLPR